MGIAAPELFHHSVRARRRSLLGALQFGRRRPAGLDRDGNAGQLFYGGAIGALQHSPHHPGLDRNPAAFVNVATTNLIDPFGSGSQNVGNLAASVYVSNTYPTGTMDLIYWNASTIPGDYAVEFQPITTTYVKAPSSGPSTVLTGGPTQIDAAVSQPLSWNLTNNYTGSVRRN